ncbi:hypothetical protein ACFFIS_16400 [Virgibacillus soli]|uniref:Uncharacterized protein n=1 Tax=Paracerasibacillus soli TaxID=480284 RepID=A0ABU5CX53_9BACI|nr:hypothetical protein [Virgibacillus soli]MDY0410429.1 hypothetical protein [Virgibacillus soli]
MKRYLTSLFILFTAIIIVVGLRLTVPWSGIVTWGLAAITLLLAAYYTKYIPNESKQKSTSKRE